MEKIIENLLNIEYPIIQGGMAWIADAPLAAAVSNGGGLGLIAAGSAPADWVRAEIQKARVLTDRPFGVNIMMMSPFAEEIAQMVCEEKVSVVTTGAGNPGKYIPMWHEAGIKVIPVIPSRALALRMQKAGADAVIAEGCEAGGHIGELTTMALVPQVCDTVQIPVIAAGGIADGRGIAAVRMLGAKGVQVGTRFLAAAECTVHENYKQKILEAKDTDTTVTGRSTGHPVRLLKNHMAKQASALENQNASLEEVEEFLTGTLRLAAKDGDIKNGSVMAGQVAGLVKSIQPAAEIIREMFAQCDIILKGAV